MGPWPRRRLLWVAVFVSLFGSGLSTAAASWFVLERTGSTLAVGALWVLITGPGVLVPALGGVIIDRSDRRRLHVVLDLLRGGLTVAAGALVRDADLALRVVFALQLLLGIGWAMSWPTLAALVQERTEKDRLVGANAAYQISVQGGMMSAGAVVGFLYARLGLSGILFVDAATYVASAVCIGMLSRGAATPAAEGARRFVEDLREGIAYLSAHPAVFAMGAAWACMLGGILSATVLLVALARDVLHAGPRGYGYLEAGWATGAVIGGLLAMRLVRPRTASVFPMVALSTLAAGSALLPWLTVLPLAVGAQVVLGVTRALGGVAMHSAVMAAVPPRLMGRVQSAFSTLSTVLQVLMSVLLGWLAQASSIAAGFMAVGVLYAVAAAAAARAWTLGLGGAAAITEAIPLTGPEADRMAAP